MDQTIIIGHRRNYEWVLHIIVALAPSLSPPIRAACSVLICAGTAVDTGINPLVPIAE